MTSGNVSRGNHRQRYIGTNLKMHQTPSETRAFLEGLQSTLPSPSNSRDAAQLFVIPPFTSLVGAVETNQKGSLPLWIGAQNMHEAESGAYTGEISAAMLQGIGVDLVLLGHAERRGLFGETDAALSLKIPAALAAGMRVLFCVGETAEERNWGVGPETVARQVNIGLSGVDTQDLDRVLIGYEPIWSIGAGGTPATPEQVEPIAMVIHQAVHERFGAGLPVPILYGGSVNPVNAGDFVALPSIDGLFVGRAAWTVEGFRDIVRSATT